MHLYEFEVILVYDVSSSTVKIISQRKQKQKKKREREIFSTMCETQTGWNQTQGEPGSHCYGLNLLYLAYTSTLVKMI